MPGVEAVRGVVVHSWAAVGSDSGTAWLMTRSLERRDGNAELMVNIACTHGSMDVEVVTRAVMLLLGRVRVRARAFRVELR